ncbi:MAG: Do/DeqQ family serine protease [Gammaproteobacteria bacterium]|jgi:Do/DeqQ family serine protease
MIRFLVLLLFLASFPAFSALPLAIDGAPLPSLAPMLDETTRAVVNIATRGQVKRKIELPFFKDPLFQRFFNRRRGIIERIQETSSLGSGVIVDADKGYILTNDHVIQDAFEITVTLIDGREFSAEILGRDADTDIAVIKIEAENLDEIPLFDSGQLRVGDFVVAIGNPFGLGQTVTSGIVSALGRSGLGIESVEDFIQTDASINPGNSGGALVNLRGELVGINTAIYGAGGQGSIGIGFAIPSNLAIDVMRQLIEHGKVKRGRFGARGQDMTEKLAQAFGLKQSKGFIITQIEKGSPAHNAGIQVGDVIVSANGRSIKSSSDMQNLVGLMRIGQTIELEIFRTGKRLRLSTEIKPMDLSSIDGAIIHPRLAGAIIGEIQQSSLLQGQLSYLQIIDVDESKQAWQAGLRPDDIIYAINKEAVEDLDQLFEAAERNKNNLLLNIQRNGREHFLLLK